MQSQEKQNVGTSYRNRSSINLNLYNFESEEASNYPYILTSPRSLKACNLAHIKPIELLHRSAADIATDFNIPADLVDSAHANYEQERLRKLELCKLLRRRILQSCEIDSVSQKAVTNFSPNSLPRESTSRSSCYTRDTPECYSSAGNQALSSYSTPTTPVQRYSSLRKQNHTLNRYSLSSSSSSILSFAATLQDTYQRRRSKSADCKKINLNYKQTTKRTTSNAKKTCSKFKQKKGKTKAPQNDHPPVFPERINDRELCRKIDNVKNSVTVLVPKKSTNTENMRSSKSSTSLNVKKLKNKHNMNEQKFLKNCEKALTPNEEAQKSHKNNENYTINQKSKTERLQKSESENCLKKYNDKFNENIKSTRIGVEYPNKDKQLDFVDGTQNLKDHDLRILDAMALKREIQQSQDNLAQKARIVWATTPNTICSTSNCPNKILNKENLSKLENNNECAHQSENLTFETYFNHIRNKMKQLKEDSLNKELHGEHVRQLARELQAGMEQWQDQVLLLQWRAVQRARTNAKLHIENKRLKTQCENNERALLHALRFKSIQNMEKVKEINMKKEIEEKDKKIEKLKVKREREILDCRTQAHYTAELREQLRRTLTPQTFDQKANDAVIKSRFINRSLTASPFIESHIRLG